ncbi:ankyrin repeat domain-containing protein [Luteimonas sp. RIT-PG2_3]
MPEPTVSRRPALLALALGLVLAAISAIGVVPALIAGWLAQPAFALAARWRRGIRPPAWPALRTDIVALLLAWGGALLLVALLVAWPLSALRQTGGLGAALALSAAAGVCLIGLWRTWPLWHGLEREGGSIGAHWRALADRDAGSWRGAAAGVSVAVALACVLLLAWPGLLPDHTRGVFAGVSALFWLLSHGVLQRLREAERLPLQVVEMQAADAAAPFEEGLDGDLGVALYAAARSGRVDRALDLIEAGADLQALPAEGERDQRSLPVLAAVLPDLRLLRVLIGRGIDLNAAQAGMTPLLAATRDSWHGRPEAVMTLLANGADPRAVDRDGNTPLHHAARSSDPGVAALLRDAAAELDARNHDGVTPLGVACASGNWRLARFLLERGAKAEIASGSPALLSAAGTDEDDPAGVQLLLKHKARVDARDAQGRSALHEAALRGHADIIAILLAAGADVHARDLAGRTPLLDGARGAHLAAVETLLAAHSDARVVDNDGRNALTLVCLAEVPSPPLVQRLRELGVPPDQADHAGRHAIEHAASAGRWSLVSLLDPSYPLPARVVDEEGAPVAADQTPLALLRDGLRSGRDGNLDALSQLLDADELGGLLFDAEIVASPEHIDWLMARGANTEVRNDAGDTPLFALLSLVPASLPAIQSLLRHGVSPGGRGGLARFLAACVRSDQAGRALEHCALELLARGADPFAASPEGDPALPLVVRLGWNRVLEQLIGNGCDLDARDAHGMSALHLCAALGREAALKTLLLHGASVDLRAQDGQTPLGVALASGRRDLADWLDWRGWALPGRPLNSSDVPLAATAGDVGAVRRLLDLGLAVDTIDNQGCTALLRAAGGGHRAVVDLLLDRGADPQHAAHSGATPLSAAVSMRQGDIVERLLQAGAGLEQRLPNDVTVLMLAAALGLPDLCARLLTAGANVHATDSQGLTPLHCAALHGFTARDRPRLLALFDTLLLAGADVDAVAAGGVTPLLLLIGARAEPGTACDEEVIGGVLEQLLDERVALDAQDPRGFGPLHLTALHGLLRTAQRLLRAGADPELRDNLNRTPRDIAVMRGFIDVAAEFMPVQAQPGVSMARFLRDRG